MYFNAFLLQKGKRGPHSRTSKIKIQNGSVRFPQAKYTDLHRASRKSLPEIQ